MAHRTRDRVLAVIGCSLSEPASGLHEFVPASLQAGVRLGNGFWRAGPRRENSLSENTGMPVIRKRTKTSSGRRLTVMIPAKLRDHRAKRDELKLIRNSDSGALIGREDICEDVKRALRRADDSYEKGQKQSGRRCPSYGEKPPPILSLWFSFGSAGLMQTGTRELVVVYSAYLASNLASRCCRSLDCCCKSLTCCVSNWICAACDWVLSWGKLVLPVDTLEVVSGAPAKASFG
jgi:hypothetical protein